jgi:CheY-like chemotaxis protein
MVVEDMALVAVEIERQLRNMQYTVLGPYPSLDAALDAVSAEPPLEIDIALLDVNLAGSECYPLADILQSRGIHFCFLTGYLKENIPARYADVPVLEKPFSRSELQGTLRGLLEAAHHGEG